MAALHPERPQRVIWFFIEAGVALALAIFIVWFTLGGKRKEPPDASHDRGSGDGDKG